MRRTMYTGLTAAATIAVATSSTLAEPVVREVTAFKDGHALVLRTGSVAVDQQGDAVISSLPSSIMGAFWVDEREPNARLASVTAARTHIKGTRVVGSNADLVRANIGREIAFRDAHDEHRTGSILRIVGDSGPVVLIADGDQIAALPINEISDLRFLDGEPAQDIEATQSRDTLTLDLEWDGTIPDEASVSVMSIERGVRWIPSYRVTVVDDDRVRVELRAALINELSDLQNATVHLAVGVPSFAFAETPDPMGLRDRFADLGMYFRRSHGNQTADMFSNALMSQVADMDFRSSQGRAAPDQPASPSLTGSERAEDLYVFTIEGITLAQGARMSLPIAEYELPYETLYRLDIPGGPPDFALGSLDTDRQRELVNMLDHPTPIHILRIENTNPDSHPITTAPATIFRDGRVLAQGLLRYTAPGASIDLEVGSAVDITVATDEIETAREQNSIRIADYNYARVDIEFGTVLTNRKPHPVTVEVRKVAFGQPTSVDHHGRFAALSVFSHDLPWNGAGAAWWRRISWPWYWHRVNGAARFDWTVTIEPGESTELSAAWHYFFR